MEKSRCWRFVYSLPDVFPHITSDRLFRPSIECDLYVSLSPAAFAERLCFISSRVSSDTGGGVGLHTLNLRRGQWMFKFCINTEEKEFHCCSQESLLRTTEFQSMSRKLSKKACELNVRQLRPVRYWALDFALGMVVNIDTRLWWAA